MINWVEAKNKYADLMEVFEAGYAAKEKEIIDKVIANAERDLLDSRNRKT